MDLSNAAKPRPRHQHLQTYRRRRRNVAQRQRRDARWSARRWDGPVSHRECSCFQMRLPESVSMLGHGLRQGTGKVSPSRQDRVTAHMRAPCGGLRGGALVRWLVQRTRGLPRNLRRMRCASDQDRATGGSQNVADREFVKDQEMLRRGMANARRRATGLTTACGCMDCLAGVQVFAHAKAAIQPDVSLALPTPIRLSSPRYPPPRARGAVLVDGRTCGERTCPGCFRGGVWTEKTADLLAPGDEAASFGFRSAREDACPASPPDQVCVCTRNGPTRHSTGVDDLNVRRRLADAALPAPTVSDSHSRHTYPPGRGEAPLND